MSNQSNIKRKLLSAAIAPVLSIASFGAYAQLVDENPGFNGTVPDGGATLLVDQTGNTPRGNGAPDQDFEAAFDVYDSEAADDFVIPGGVFWDITEVSLVGTQSTGGTAAGVSINFYPDGGGLPDTSGGPLCSYTNIPTVDVGGSLTTTLPTSCTLDGGATYWMAHQTVQDFGGGNGQHFFSNTDVVTGNGAAWRNPGDGFGSGCTDFMDAAGCGVGGGGVTYDFLYSLGGTEGVAAPEIVPTLDWRGMLAMTLGLGLFGAWAFGRRREEM